MSNKMSSIYCLLFVLVITLAFSHFIDIPNIKEGFDSLSNIIPSGNDITDESQEDILLNPASAPGGPSPQSSPQSSSPSSNNNLPPNYGIPVRSSTNVESFQTYNSENTKSTNKQKPINNGIIDHIFTDKKSDFSLKQF